MVNCKLSDVHARQSALRSLEAFALRIGQFADQIGPLDKSCHYGIDSE